MGGTFLPGVKGGDFRYERQQAKLSQSLSSTLARLPLAGVVLPSLRGWIDRRLAELVGIADEVLLELVINTLEELDTAEAGEMRLLLTPFMGNGNAEIFVKELWRWIIKAKEDGGIPTEFAEEYKKALEEEENLKKATATQRQKNRQVKRESRDSAPSPQRRRRDREYSASPRRHGRGRDPSSSPRQHRRDRDPSPSPQRRRWDREYSISPRQHRRDSEYSISTRQHGQSRDRSSSPRQYRLGRDSSPGPRQHKQSRDPSPIPRDVRSPPHRTRSVNYDPTTPPRSPDTPPGSPASSSSYSSDDEVAFRLRERARRLLNQE
jgi:serine/arginine repetitive matrix protein 1